MRRSDLRLVAHVSLGALWFACAACGALLQLDQFDKVDGGGEDGSAEAATDAGADVSYMFGEASVAQRWARWRMPNPVSNAELPTVHPMSIDANGHDAVTNLTWSKQVQQSMGYTDAFQHCEKQQMRLPTRIELVSIIDYTQPSGLPPALMGSAGQYWTQSPALPEQTKVWGVTFGTTISLDVIDLTTNPTALVRCVR